MRSNLILILIALLISSCTPGMDMSAAERRAIFEHNRRVHGVIPPTRCLMGPGYVFC